MTILSAPPAPAQTTDHLNPDHNPTSTRFLPPHQRQQLALDALNGQPIADLARHYDVSRPFIYQQVDKAQQALQQAFDPPPEANDVLFYLPVTKRWIQQLVLALILICHCSYRGVQELLADLLDYPLSLGSIHNIVHQAVPQAQRFNTQQDLAPVRIGLHDEIFQTDWPVLVGVDADSTYCYLLSLEEHADTDTWGVRLLELVDRGFDPDGTVADGGLALRAGQQLALPQTPCCGDVFHILYEIRPLINAVEQRAYAAIASRSQLEKEQARFEFHKGRKDRSVSQDLGRARLEETQALALVADVTQLIQWLREDILSVNGPEAAVRRELLDFVVAELRARGKTGPALLGKARRSLQRQGEQLLAFALKLDRDLAAVALAQEIPLSTARAVFAVQALGEKDQRRWPAEAQLWQDLGQRYPVIRAAVADVARRVVRSSALVENLNSRLRNYFFLRRQLGPEYLGLLQFFLNHRRYPRSERPERQGKSPAELLTGQAHAHWLELLGYERFSRN